MACRFFIIHTLAALPFHIIHDYKLNNPQAALRHMLINSTENALAYGENKTVTVELECQYKDVLIRVIEQGTQLEPEPDPRQTA